MLVLSTRDGTDYPDWKPHASLHDGVDVTPWLGTRLHGFSIETRHKLIVLTLLSGKEKYPPAASLDGEGMSLCTADHAANGFCAQVPRTQQDWTML